VRYLRILLYILTLAAAYFVSAYFAVAALMPEWAYPAGLIAMILALPAYRLLIAIGQDESGPLMGMLIILPGICTAAGIIWWIARFLGFWD
jgi:hypothetical protein